MNDTPITSTSRRDFIKSTSTVVAASALTGVTLPSVHAAGSDLIQVVLVGCGGRGTGAATQALSTTTGPIKLIAMADVFPDKLTRSFENIRKDCEKKQTADRMDVPAERRFIGFDGYKKAMDCLKPGDIVILATPPAFRWVHFTYAIEKNLNVFMEKPVTVDGPSTRRMLALGEESKKKNLKVGVGLMVRHCKGRQELHERIRNGEIGDLLMLRAYRMSRMSGVAKNNPDLSEVMFQIRNFHSFLWASGGVYSDYYIHQIDECSWMKNAWPIKAHAIGARHYREDSVDQNFDNYSVEYTFPDGTKFFLDGRNVSGCTAEFASYAHGTKGSAVVSTSGHYPGKVRIYKGHNQTPENLAWAFPQPEPSPYQLEWDDLVSAIRTNQPYNEVERGATASLVTCMGRMAAHTGQVITYDDMLNCPHEFAPTVDQLLMDGPAPLKRTADGQYPYPKPGVLKDREYDPGVKG
ncbi:MAG: Gfo/Idh/MocA family oxidoreductase [Verrucomicrobiota bacterium]